MDWESGGHGQVSGQNRVLKSGQSKAKAKHEASAQRNAKLGEYTVL